MDEIVSINPATLESLGKFPSTPPSKVRESVAAARAAQPSWAKLSPRGRGRYLLLARDHIVENIDETARTITRDNGKPMAEALISEIYPACDLLAHLAGTAAGILSGHPLPIGVMRLMRRSSRLILRPLGVVGVIGPWNYPFSIPLGQAAAALIAGNAVLMKPSSATPLVGRMIEEAFGAAGLPRGIFTHLPGDAEAGRALVRARVDKIAFTGSVGVGKDVMRACAENPTPLLLELGGKDPMIVREDADIEQATSGAVWGAFTNCGQACASVERCYVHASIFDEFVEICVRKALALKVGNGLDPDVDVGPMTTSAQLEHVEAQVIDAKARGAVVHCGGERDGERVGFFYPPTVITDVDHSFPIVRDESFGPLLPIMPFTEDRQAVHLANDSAYGLTASIWTKSMGVAKRMGAELAAGTVTINDCLFTHALPGTPWGGVKQSGFGRSHGRAGIMEFVSPTHLHINPLTRKDPWWYPYDLAFYESFAQLARRMTGGLISRLKAAPAFLRTWRRPRS